MAPPIPQVISYTGGRTVVSWPNRVFVGKLGEFDDVLSAYLMFDYVRSHPLLNGNEVLLTANDSSGGPHYCIWVHLPDDMLAGLDELELMNENHLTSMEQYSWITTNRYSDALRSTKRFIEAYNSPDFPTLAEIPSEELQKYVRQFICFKASVDPRTWDGNQGPLVRPRLDDAEGLAQDIVEVAGFYNLPVDVLLGIGAMENNFLNAPGDLNNAVWKKQVERDDIILWRRGREALVLNSSMGTWQITRRSLRYAHKLFLCDTRDYSNIPFELHPTEHLDMNFLSPHVLTTYAALLLRNLVDYFDGDVFLATAAYNGTKLHPKLDYALGVERIASYARRVIGNTAKIEQQLGGKSGTRAEVDPGLAKPLSEALAQPAGGCSTACCKREMWGMRFAGGVYFQRRSWRSMLNRVDSTRYPTSWSASEPGTQIQLWTRGPGAKSREQADRRISSDRKNRLSPSAPFSFSGQLRRVNASCRTRMCFARRTSTRGAGR